MLTEVDFMSERWQFWHVGADIKMRHTTNPEDERFVCNAQGEQVAEILVKILNTFGRINPPICEDLFTEITTLKNMAVDKQWPIGYL